MKQILLTGGGGFIGGHTFAHIMHNTDWHLTIIDSFRHKGKTDRITEMIESHPDWRERVTVITHDLKAPFSPQLIERIGPINYIINMASESHVDRSITDPRDFIENNVHLTLSMLEYVKGIQIGRKVTIHANADSSVIGSRYYLHARNQADALIFLLKNVEFPKYGNGNDIGRFNVVGEYEISNLELAQKVADILGKELRYELVDFHSSRPGHDLRYALDGSKLAALGWKAPLTFDESLKNTVLWTIDRPEWLK